MYGINKVDQKLSSARVYAPVTRIEEKEQDGKIVKTRGHIGNYVCAQWTNGRAVRPSDISKALFKAIGGFLARTGEKGKSLGIKIFGAGGPSGAARNITLRGLLSEVRFIFKGNPDLPSVPVLTSYKYTGDIVGNVATQNQTRLAEDMGGPTLAAEVVPPQPPYSAPVPPTTPQTSSKAEEARMQKIVGTALDVAQKELAASQAKARVAQLAIGGGSTPLAIEWSPAASVDPLRARPSSPRAPAAPLVINVEAYVKLAQRANESKPEQEKLVITLPLEKAGPKETSF